MSFKQRSTMIQNISELKPSLLFKIIGHDGFFNLGKIIMGLGALSFPIIINGFYGISFGIARLLAYTMRPDEELTRYRTVAQLLILIGVLYIIYTLRLFFIPSKTIFPMEVALLIALYTFIELTIDIISFVRLRHTKDIKSETLRFVSLASTMTWLVLTQTAIMSFANAGDDTYANIIAGIIFGLIVTVMGIIMCLRYRYFLKNIQINTTETFHQHATNTYKL